MRMSAFLLRLLIPATAGAQTDFPAEEFKARHANVFEATVRSRSLPARAAVRPGRQ